MGEAKLQQRFTGDGNLFAFAGCAESGPTRCARQNSNARTLTAAGQPSNKCTETRAANNLFRGIRSLPSSFYLVAGGNQRVGGAVDEDVGQFQSQFGAPAIRPADLAETSCP